MRNLSQRLQDAWQVWMSIDNRKAALRKVGLPDSSWMIKALDKVIERRQSWQGPSRSIL